MEVLKQLHTSVAKVFENSFDHAYQALNAHLAFREAQVEQAEKRAKIAEDAHNNAITEIARLKDEISVLQEQLRQNDMDLKNNNFTEETSRQLKRAYDPDVVLPNTEDIKVVSAKYTELYEQVITLVQASGDLRTQVKRHKRKLENLQKCFLRQEFRIDVGGVPVRFERAQSTATQDQGEPSAVNLTRPTSQNIEFSKHKLRVIDAQSQVASKPGPNYSILGTDTEDTPEIESEKQIHTQNSESTLSPPDYSTSGDEIQPATVPSSSASTNNGTLKRKRPTYQESLPKGIPSSKSVSPGEIGHPIIIKSETMSSGSLLVSSPPSGIAGTQDLDEIGNTVQTPTRRNQITGARDSRFNNVPPPVESPSRRYLEPQGRTINRNGRLSKWSGVLQPVDCNLKTTANGFGQPASKRGTRNSRKSSKSRIASIAEDGDENYAPRTTPRAQGLDTRNRPSDNRLEKLLETSPPVTRFLGLASTNEKAPRSRRPAVNDSSLLTSLSDKPVVAPEVTKSSKSSSGRLINAQEDRTYIHPHQSPSDLPEVLPDDEPYRIRPLEQLGLEHFKLNPAYNHGLDFAFDEVVRNKNERKCLEGCTRPNCCGQKFRALARFSLTNNAPNSRQQEEDDQKLLQEYMGDESHLINSLSPAERQGLLEEAKARSFANRFGRHRHQHQRPGTPPGFWRTEMPGTQELEKDHEEARQIDREKVKERYREAMRQGGRWKFADE